MTQPGFPPRPGFQPGPGPAPQGWGLPQRPVQQGFNQWGGQPPWGPAPQQPPPPQWGPPVQHPPQPPWGAPPQQQAPPSARGPKRFLLLAVVVLLGLLAYAASSGPDTTTVETGYQNEDYGVPGAGEPVSEILIPQYEAEIADWLEDNAVYQQQLASPVRCDIARIPDPGAMGDQELQARMRSFVECLTRVWGPALEAAGFEAYQPTLYVYPSGGEVSTSCGTQPSLNAFYCGADQNLYLASDVLRILPATLGRQPVAFDLIIAHEYGHAMQGRTGVFAASHYLVSETSGTEALGISRRVELQADCFAGGGLHSLAEGLELGPEQTDALKEISYEIGDDRLAERFQAELEEGDHGLGENRRLWAERGLSGNPLSVCNTFVAPSSEVR